MLRVKHKFAFGARLLAVAWVVFAGLLLVNSDFATSLVLAAGALPLLATLSALIVGDRGNFSVWAGAFLGLACMFGAALGGLYFLPAAPLLVLSSVADSLVEQVEAARGAPPAISSRVR